MTKKKTLWRVYLIMQYLNYTKYVDYKNWVREQKIEGFENGLTYDDYKEGDIVGIFRSDIPAEAPKFTTGKVVEKISGLNAKGKDTIRTIICNVGDNVNHSITSPTQIKDLLFKKITAEDLEKKEKPKRGRPKKAKEPKIAQQDEPKKAEGEKETIQIQRAMTARNPLVKEYLADGWKWVGKEWNAELNMYIATLERA
jgi:hypothetical protein